MLEASGLVRRYRGVLAVSDVSLGVARGEVVGLVGPNGAGKSTVFRILAGLERSDAGRVVLGGVDVSAWPLPARARAGLAYLAQGPSVLPMLTVAENVAMAVRAAGRPASDLAQLLAEHDLEPFAGRRAGLLSGGERRRVEIARAWALRPRVVLLDEPFAGVDPAHVSAIQARIRAMAAAGMGVLLTDHAVREALRSCDRAILLDGGVVQAAGTPAEIAANPRALDRYLGAGFRLD
jgi:lipopolysaccharide export system ATP-binding protein